MRYVRRTLCLVGLTVCLLPGLFSAQSKTPAKPTIPPSDADIRRILAERVNALAGGADGIGIVVGVVGPHGRRIISYGHPSQGDSRLLDGNSVFEMGSVAKGLTALLLADMVRRGEVALADPASRFLPDMHIPTRAGRSITLVDLATHTSALPFMPELSAATGAGHTAPDLRAFLAGYQLPRDIGTTWDYSNLGYWLLGEALASRAGMTFESLLRVRVLTPLKLLNTSFVLSPTMEANLAVGHDASLAPAPPSSTLPVYSLMPAAGIGLYTTANDLSTLLSLALGYKSSPLSAALAGTVTTHRPKAPDGDQQALGWIIIGTGNDRLIFQEGGTLGYASCIAWDPVKRVGVAVLSNQVASVADIARHLLRPAFPLGHPSAARHTEISLDATLLDSYVGRYDAPGEGVFRVFRDGDHLALESPSTWGLPVLWIRPATAGEFFVSELPLRVTFQTDSAGHVTGILVYPPRGQKAVPARRISEDR